MASVRSMATIKAAAVGFAIAGLLAVATPAAASGFALREGSADWMGNAFAGGTAKAYDASTVWSNPAGMVRLNWNEIDAAANLILANSKFSGGNTIGGAPTGGTTGSNLIEPGVTGGLYGVWSFSPSMKFGLSVSSPFGQRVTNPTNFVGRYQSLVSSISDVQVAIAGAYKINEQWSIGGGPVIDILSARLTQAINLGPLAPLTGDAVGDLHGSDTAVGFNVGVLYQATPDLRFGADYHSRIQHNISGAQSATIPGLVPGLSAATAAFLTAQNSPAATKLTLPDSVTLGVYWQVTPALALLADAGWTHWGLLKTINVVPSGAGAQASSLVEGWNDTVALSVGANYQLTESLMLQGGIGYDQSPVKASNRSTRIPDSDRYLFGVGVQYEAIKNVTLQLAYAHIVFASASIANAAAPSAGAIAGSYSNAADTVAFGVKVKF